MRPPTSRRTTRRKSSGQMLVVFALGFALFLFSLTCLVADAAYLYTWSGRVQAAAQVAAQSGADAVDPRYLYAETQACAAQPVGKTRCAVPIVDVSAQDRRGSLYAFQRACIQAGDQSARVPRNPPADPTPKTVSDVQLPDGTACASDGCQVYAVVTMVVALPIAFPGFPAHMTVRGTSYAAPVTGTTVALAGCTGTVWVPAPPG